MSAPTSDSLATGDVTDILAEFTDYIVLPDSVQSETVDLLGEAVENDVFETPVSVANIAAAAVLCKRTSETQTRRDAQSIAGYIDGLTYKKILTHVDTLSESSITSLSNPGDDQDFADALVIAADEIDVTITDESSIGGWCDNHGLGKNGDAAAVTSRQAALTVVLRSTVFDSVLGTPIMSISQQEYAELIRRAHGVAGDRSPAWFAIDSLVEDFPEPVFDWLLELADSMYVVDSPSEFLGSVYEKLIEQENRWRLGQFRTPEKLAALMAEIAVTDGDEDILSPGIGAGALTAAAVQRKERLGNEKAFSDITGIDVSPISVLLGSAATLQHEASGMPSMREADFFDTTPDDIGNVDAVLSNPPYTKHHELPDDMKNSINEALSTRTGYSFSKLSPLYVYFTVQATQFLDEGDAAVFLTPAEILNTEYGTAWKQFLQEQYDVDAFVMFDPSNGSKFDGVATTSLITVATRRNSAGSASGSTTFIRVDDEFDLDEIVSTIRAPPQDADGVTADWGFINTVNNATLAPSENWSSFFDGVDPVIDEQLIPLSSIARVTRGIATGQNSFFCLSESDLVGEGNGESWEIEESFLSPIVRKSHRVPDYDFRDADWEAQREEDVEVWLLYHLDELDWDPTLFRQEIADEETSQQQLAEFSPDDAEEIDDTASLTDTERDVVSYLKYGMQLDDPPHETHLAEQRESWYTVEQREPGDILYTSMTRDRGRFVYNEVGARNLNNVHSVHLTADLSEQETKALLAYLNSEFADKIIKRSGRTLGSGMTKIEPGDLKNIPVIDPRELEPDTVAELADLFDNLCTAARNDDIDESGVRESLQNSLSTFLDI